MDNTIEKRIKRVDAAVALTEPDRVPMAPKIGMAYAEAAGIHLYDALNDVRNLRPGVERFLKRYEPDLFWGAAGYPIPVMETLGTTAIRWPGATCGLDLNRSFQIVDRCYMEDEEYDELIRNPAHFFMTKLFPRKHKALKGLEKVSFNNVVEFGHFASMQCFADPDVRSSLLSLMLAGEQAARWQAGNRELVDLAASLQTPPGGIVGQNAPYDMLADNIRGFLNVPMDVLEMPEKVLAAIEVMTQFALENVQKFQSVGAKYCFMPLHGGTDDFMSNDTYLKFYWPSLRKVIGAVIDCGMIPYLFFEGKYNSRLELLRDVPRGSCIYMFEQVDMARAKKILGDTVCMTGNLPTSLLAFGKRQEVIDETKRLIDTCAPGGGFLMDCSIVLDHYHEENLDAWFETTATYGTYH